MRRKGGAGGYSAGVAAALAAGLASAFSRSSFTQSSILALAMNTDPVQASISR